MARNRLAGSGRHLCPGFPGSAALCTAELVHAHLHEPPGGHALRLPGPPDKISVVFVCRNESDVIYGANSIFLCFYVVARLAKPAEVISVGKE